LLFKSKTNVDVEVNKSIGEISDQKEERNVIEIINTKKRKFIEIDNIMNGKYE
jgi:hypothetical protein